MNKKLLTGIFTLTGTIIGAGILGLPYVFKKSGFLIGVSWLIMIGLMMIFINLLFAEITLRTKGVHQITGYAEKYLGKSGKYLMFFALLFGIYSALIAYLIGEGQSFSYLFFGNIQYSFYFAVGFWLIMTLFLREGLKGLKKIETWGVWAIFVIVLGILIWFFPQIKIERLLLANKENWFLPFGVILFALMGYAAIPELKRELKGNEKLLKKAIIFGTLIPLVIYFIFSGVFVGVLEKIPEVATLGLGILVLLFGIFTMLTSYFVLSFALKDAFEYDFNSSKFINIIFTSIIPLLIYLIIVKFKILGFSRVLGIGGVVSGGLTGILILIMNLKAKKIGNRKPEFKMPINWIIIIILSLIFSAGIWFELRI